MNRYLVVAGAILFLVSACTNLQEKRETVHLDFSPEFEAKAKVFPITPRQAYNKMREQYNTVFMPTSISIVGNYYLIMRAKKVEAPIGKAYLVDGFTGEIIPINSDISIKNGTKIDMDRLLNKMKEEQTN